MQDQIVVKVIVVGDVGVGKTSLLTQYCFEQFDPHQSPTIGCDFSTKVVKKNGNPLKLQLWDVAGQEKFQSLSKLFIRGAQGCLVVTDITNNDSLDNAILWKELVANEVTDIPIFLIQNKTDLVSRSQSVLCLESLQNIGQNYNFLKWFQISAKNGENVGIMFYELVDAMVEKGTLKLDENVIKSSFSLRNHSQTKSNSEINKKCC